MIAKQFDPKLELKYNKNYIGVGRDGAAFNFLVFRPKRRILREIRRRTRVVGAFPDGQSALNLAAARLRPHCWHGMVDQTIPQHWTAEGPVDERCHHRLS